MPGNYFSRLQGEFNSNSKNALAFWISTFYLTLHSENSIFALAYDYSEKNSTGSSKMIRFISVNPEICGGKPCITGTRIPVYMILELIEQGLSFEKITSDFYPQLSIDQIKACINYANSLVKNEDIFFVGEQAA